MPHRKVVLQKAQIQFLQTTDVTAFVLSLSDEPVGRLACRHTESDGYREKR